MANKIKLSMCLVALMCLSNLTACNSDVEEQSTTNESTTTSVQENNDENATLLTASDVLVYLQSNCSNIGNYIEYTEETDTNELLGRPNQYTSKINGADTRVEQDDENDPKGFSIEVFSNNQDALARQEYINSIGEEIPTLVEYNYVNDYILLRVNKSLSPTEAKEYEDALNKIFE